MTNKKQTITKVGTLAAVFAVALAPVAASAATDSASTTINANVGSTISISTSSTVALNVTPVSGGSLTSASDTVSVSTNNAGGYNLTLADSDAVTNLVSGGNTIAAHAGTQASPSALPANTWGYAVASQGGFAASYSVETNATSSTSTWAGVPASGSANTIKNTASTASNDATTVWYAVNVDTDKPNGTYTDSVTYTATTN